MSLLLLLAAPPATGGVVARGVLRPVRVPRTPRLRRVSGPQRLGQRASAAEAITGTATALFGLTVTGSGTVAPPAITGAATVLFGLTVSGSGTLGGDTGLVARGVRRPVRTVRSPRLRRTNGPARLSGLEGRIVGTGTALFGLTVTGNGTFTPPITGTASVLFGLTVSGLGSVGGLTGPGVILGDVVWAGRIAAALTYRTRHQGDATYQPRHGADLTQRVRHDGDTTYKTRD